MFIKHITGTIGAIVHDGEEFVHDAEGVFDVPFELAKRLLRMPGWVEKPGILVDRRQGHETYPPEPAPEPETPAVPAEPETPPANDTKAAKATK